MASRLRLPKLGQYIPLWRRRIPDYPLYLKGNPQLRIFTPLFWMRVIKPKLTTPPNWVLFETHPQMTDTDIKNYLTKIYDIPVQYVKTQLVPGEVQEGEQKMTLNKFPDKRIAYIQLKPGEKFDYPDLFKDVKAETPKDTGTMIENEKMEAIEKKRQSQWDKQDLAPWFR